MKTKYFVKWSGPRFELKSLLLTPYSLLTILIALSFLVTTPAFADNTQLPSWSLVEKSDFSRYENGKYVGHVYREIRAQIKEDGEETNGYIPYKGNFIVMEETLRDMRQSAKAVDDIVPVRFMMSPDGIMRIENDKGFPVMRNFPIYDLNDIKTGDKWTAEGMRSVDPLNSGKPVIYQFTAEYEYKGTEVYYNIPVHHISARYSSNMSPAEAFDSSTFSTLRGSHNVDILIAVADGMLVMQRDKSDETFWWKTGNTLRFTGFTLTFGQGLNLIDTPAIENSVKNAPGIDVEKIDTGLRLTLKELQFKSNSDELLDVDKKRLDIIAESLSKTGKRTFLVEGHTAAIGQQDSEQELSVRRARRIVDEMVMRGMSADSFVYKGWGGTKPIGDNATDSGRSINRRVEITILE